MNAPVNAATHAAESRALWRAVYVAALVKWECRGIAAKEANDAMQPYAIKFQPKPRKGSP
jgi:hypothetical protein